jgi:hypothetical protein
VVQEISSFRDHSVWPLNSVNISLPPVRKSRLLHPSSVRCSPSELCSWWMCSFEDSDLPLNSPRRLASSFCCAMVRECWLRKNTAGSRRSASELGAVSSSWIDAWVNSWPIEGVRGGF